MEKNSLGVHKHVRYFKKARQCLIIYLPDGGNEDKKENIYDKLLGLGSISNALG